MNLLVDTFLNPPAVIWPLGVLLCVLLVARHARETLAPISKSVVEGLARDAQRNSRGYAMAIAFGLSASLSAWVEAFKDLSATQAAAMSYWQLSAVFAKIANPFIVAVLAYTYKQGSSNGTQPPSQQ